MGGGEMAVFVLDEMQMLDQEVAPAWPLTEQRPNILQRLRVDLAASRGLPRAAAPPTRTVELFGGETDGR